MSTGSDDLAARGREDLSALVDGELRGQAVADAFARWRDDASTRSAWHAYQLIGDVLRSEDLASGARRDRRFVETLRVRLAAEPVVLAPQVSLPETDEHRIVAERASHWRWKATSAVAAGFLTVAGVVSVLRAPVTGPAPGTADLIAALPTKTASAPTAMRPAAASQEVPVAVSGEMLRDAGLDRYLAAHKRFAGSTALGLPSSFMRSATTAESVGR